ncbi:MAG: outer membrane beta-barrel protein [Capnocytophaga sp.]|nr:outer membrane beta-barrel protein [Capnocytophaga sp.]
MKTFLFLLFPLYLFSQEINYGLKGGITNTALIANKDDSSITTYPLPSFYVGGYAEYKVRKNSFQVDVLYENNLFRVRNTYFSRRDNYRIWYPDYRKNISIHKIALPLSYKIHFTRRFALSMGEITDFRLYTRSKSDQNTSLYDYEDAFGSINGTNNISSLLKPIDVSIFVGVNLYFSQRFFADARLSFSTIDMLKSPEYNYTNVRFNIGFNYRLNNHKIKLKKEKE